VTFLDVLPEPAERKEERKPSDLITLSEIDDPWVVDKLMLAVLKHVDQVENYAQWVFRRLADRGVYTSLDAKVQPAPNGFTLVLTVSLAGIKAGLLKEVKLYRKRVRKMVESVNRQIVENVRRIREEAKRQKPSEPFEELEEEGEEEEEEVEGVEVELVERSDNGGRAPSSS